MSADFESELAALYGRQPDMPDAGGFALGVTERIVREEKRNFLFALVTVGGVLALAVPVALKAFGVLSATLGDMARATESLPPLSLPTMSSPVMISTVAVVALGAVLLGRMQARRL